MNNGQNLAGTMIGNIDHHLLHQAVEILSKEQGSPDRLGGVLAIAVIYIDDHDTYFESSQIGVPGLKLGRYARNAAEKFNRLFERRQAGNDEIAASESANDALGTYGGCIAFLCKRNQEIYISFSGAPPEVDEAIAFVLGEQFELPLPKYENPLIPRARELLKKAVTPSD